MNNYKIFVINLESDLVRKNKMKEILKKNKLRAIFFKAIEGLPIDSHYNDFARSIFLGRRLLDSEIGCTESHLKLLNQIVDKNIKRALILEDDIEIKGDLNKLLKKILKLDYKWDLIRFNYKNKYKKFIGREVIKIDNQFSLVRLPKLPGGAYAYFISLEGAKKLINMAKSYYHPIDILMGQTWKHNLNSLFCTPEIVIHPPIPYHLEMSDPRYIKTHKTLFSIYPYSRFFFKFYEAFMKRMHFLYKLFPDYLNRKKYQ